jgi:chromosome segregation and condensation protein ScpB
VRNTKRIEALETQVAELKRQVLELSANARAQRVTKVKATTLNTRHVKVLEQIAKNGGITAAEAVSLAGFNVSTSQMLVTDLRRAGLIASSGFVARSNKRGRRPALLCATTEGNALIRSKGVNV